MSFSDIIGHSRAVSILRRAWENNTLGHAYLFSGDEGIGKKKTAIVLAGAVNCHTPTAEGGCGSCPACRTTASLSHPDLHIIEAEGEEIRIDQIREVQSALALKPHEGKKKILIVNNAEAMNVASANAFLKTLEEPPGEVLIVLISSMPRRLLPTIRSRCQEVAFHPLPTRVLAQVLARSRGLEEHDAATIAALAHGSLGRGLAMDYDAEKAAREEALMLFSKASTMSAGQALAEAERLAKDRERLEHFLTAGIEWFRDTLVYRVTGDARLLVHRYCEETVRQWSEHWPAGTMLAAIQLMTLSRSLLDARVSAQLVSENLLLKLGSNPGRECNREP